MESKEVIEFLGKKNIEVKSHSSAIEENEAQLVKQEFSKSEAAKEGAQEEKYRTCIPSAEHPERRKTG